MAQLLGEFIFLLAAAVCCFGMTVAGLWILAPNRTKLANAPWHERARLFWPGKVFSNNSALILQAPFLFFTSFERFSEAPPMIHPLILFGALFFAVLHGGFLMRSRYEKPMLRYGEYWKRWCCEVAILGMPYVITAISIFVGEGEWTVRSTIQLAIVLALFLAHAFGASLYLVKKLGWAKPGLASMVEACAREANMQAPPTFVLPLLSANALAFPFSRQLGFGDRVVDGLSEEALRAICRHELAHLTEPLMVKLSRLVFIPFLLPLAMTGPIMGSFGVHVWALLYIVALLLMRLFNKLSRKMEDRADLQGAQNEGSSQEYSRALEKLYEMNLIPAVLKKNNHLTHPDLYDRLVRVGAPPEYPRPAPPKVGSAWILVLVCAGIAVWVATYQRFIPEL